VPKRDILLVVADEVASVMPDGTPGAGLVADEEILAVTESFKSFL
jgi:hypothetical protein